jgi:YbbR domain-containing protein
MTEKPPLPDGKRFDFRMLLRRVGKAFLKNWKLKAVSVVVAIIIWGGLISEDATLTREKVFVEVPVLVTGVDALQRSGLVVVSGLSGLEPISMRAEVPQKAYEAASYLNYSVRVDVSRINATGQQTLQVLTNSSTTFGTVNWLSHDEITVMVDEYITRRRVPVRLEKTGTLQQGAYAAGASVDPSNVVISGPRSLVEKVAYLSASYNQDLLDGRSGVQYSAVPFRLLSEDGSVIQNDLISVTSENVLLDSLLVEQSIYPMKAVKVNLTGIITGEPAPGYRVNKVYSDPAEVFLAGNTEDIDSIRMLDLASAIDVTGQRETLIRAVRINKPEKLVYISANAAYVTVEIQPVNQSDVILP